MKEEKLFDINYISKWVLQGKKIAAQKKRVQYFSFQGGDFYP